MSMSDPIADLLTRIRNAIVVKKNNVVAPHSIIKEEIAKVLLQEGYITKYSSSKIRKGVKELTIVLKYVNNESPIHEIKRISRPGLRKYAEVWQLPVVKRGLGISIVSTSKGIMTAKSARNQKMGGEVIANIW